jgi:hypothetical protein
MSIPPTSSIHPTAYTHKSCSFVMSFTLSPLTMPPMEPTPIVIVTIIPIADLPCQILRQFGRLCLRAENGAFRVVVLLLLPIVAVAVVGGGAGPDDDAIERGLVCETGGKGVDGLQCDKSCNASSPALLPSPRKRRQNAHTHAQTQTHTHTHTHTYLSKAS